MPLTPGKKPVFEATLLPDGVKQDLCRDLLNEFGAGHIIERHDEFVHGCLLPFSSHSNQRLDPTASLNWDKLTYKCLGCGSGGGLLWFIAACRPGTSATGARKWLEQHTGVGTGAEGLARLLQFFDALYSKRADRYAPIPTFAPRILDQWDWRHPYMTEVRGVPEETLERFRVGYAADYKVVKEYDLAGKPVFGSSQRITLPHFWGGDLVGWQSRRLLDDGTPKYLSSPDFPRDQTIYNYDYMAQRTVVVESPFSVLRHVHQTHMEATFGASITERQASLLQKHPEVVLFMDNDKAGWQATEALIDALKGYGKTYVVNNPYAADPADMDDETFREVVHTAVPWPLWKRPKESDLKAWEEVSAHA